MSEEKGIYLHFEDGAQLGPLTPAELVSHYRDHLFSFDVLIWKIGMSKWEKIVDTPWAIELLAPKLQEAEPIKPVKEPATLGAAIQVEGLGELVAMFRRHLDLQNKVTDATISIAKRVTEIRSETTPIEGWEERKSIEPEAMHRLEQCLDEVLNQLEPLRRDQRGILDKLNGFALAQASGQEAGIRVEADLKELVAEIRTEWKSAAAAWCKEREQWDKQQNLWHADQQRFLETLLSGLENLRAQMEESTAHLETELSAIASSINQTLAHATEAMADLRSVAEPTAGNGALAVG